MQEIETTRQIVWACKVNKWKREREKRTIMRKRRNNNDFCFEAYQIVFFSFHLNLLDMHTYLMMSIFSLIETIQLFIEHWTKIWCWKFDEIIVHNRQWIDQTKTNVIVHIIISARWRRRRKNLDIRSMGQLRSDVKKEISFSLSTSSLLT